METFEESIDIHAPVDYCYYCWHDFTSLPKFMENVKHVSPVDEHIWRWTLVGPQGDESVWDLVLIQDIPNRLIAWQTRSGPEMGMEAEVSFLPVTATTTRVTIKVMLVSPDNPIGHLLKGLFGISSREIRKNLEDFRDIMEGMLEENQSASASRGIPSNERLSQRSVRG